MIEHNLEWVAAFADRVIALAEVAILAEGKPREVLADEQVWVGRGHRFGVNANLQPVNLFQERTYQQAKYGRIF